MPIIIDRNYPCQSSCKIKLSTSHDSEVLILSILFIIQLEASEEFALHPAGQLAEQHL